MPISVSGPVTLRPLIVIWPLLQPASIIKSVLLPQPDGPTSETKAPGAMLRSTEPSA